ncbi:Mur ligase family protein [Glaciecola sp. SC05]|uniref:Mur ligase family protein n=1 Tax=Glaciecola sp. SC05 TaxID=1987355 RepID=UPI003527CC1F
MAFELDEVRRLTGPNLLSDEPGAIADVLFTEVEASRVLECWLRHLAECRTAINWQHGQQSYYRFYDGGLSVSISAPMDLLYSACELLELAWDLCVQELASKAQERAELIDLPARIEALKQAIAEEQHPALLALMHQAEVHNVLCLTDDDEISLGTGPSSQTWPVTELPDIDSIAWSDYKEVPLALITGTNGKSTSVRLAAEIAKAAGINAGVTSTDFIKVGDTIIDEGDYSGPGGARMLLRDKRTEMAFLEVARGGLLRRGLPVKQARAALVTNVASDHLGQYGINTVDDIANVKTMVGKAIGPLRSNDYLSAQTIAMQSAADKKRILVLNADDKRLAAQATLLNMPICWFSTDANHPLILQAIAKKLPCVFALNGELIYSDDKQSSIAQITDIPMTINGTAMHNVQNALGVIGLCKAMNIDEAAIKAGLLSFASSAKDNPGRGNLYEVNGVTVIVDFAHNSHSMQAVIDMASKMPAKHKLVMFSHGGDRSDQDIKDVTDAVRALDPATYVLAELERYLRGRAVGEISTLVQKHLLENGVTSNKILLADDPLDGAKKIMSHAKSGDLVLLFVLNDRENVQDYLLSLT